MQLGNRLKFLLAKRLFGVGPSDDWSYVDKFQGPTKDIKLLGMYSGIAYRCIDTIAESIGSKYQPFLYTLDANGKVITKPTHPFLTLLNHPNPDVSMYQLFEGSASFVEQFGEFFWYMVPGTKTGYNLNGPKEIYLLRPDKMGIVLDKNTGEVVGYNYSSGTGNSTIPFTAEEIIHHMTFNPKNPYRGYSTVEAAADYIKTEEEVSRFTRQYFKNNAAMSGIINVNGKVSRESWNKFVRQFRERYEGPQNAGKVALVRDSQIDFTPISSNISDMQLTDLKQSTIDQILMMFKIPKGILGMENGEGLGRASVETLEYIFAKWTLDNKMSRFDDTLQRAMDRYFPKDQLMVGHNNIIPDDKEFQLSRFNQGVDRWITRAEIRTQDPLTANTTIAGSEQLFVPLTNVPLSNPNTPQDAASSSQASLKIVKSKKKVVKDLEYSVEAKEAFRLSLQAHVNAYAARYKTGFNNVLEKQKATVLSRMKHLTGKALSDDLMDTSDEDQAFQDELTPILASLMMQQGQLALQFSGAASDAKYQLTQSVINAVAKSTKKMSQNFDAQTLSELNDTLTEGIVAGEGFDQLSNRVEDVYSAAMGWRADRIARTESQTASNAATLDAYDQNPVVTAMVWYANPDACPFCEELDGQTVGLSDSFVNAGDSVDVTNDDGSTDSYVADYGDVETPPLHPNCECTIIPETDAG